MAQSRTWSDMTDNLILMNSSAFHPPSEGGWIGRTRWMYVKLPNGDTIIDPLMGFYRDPPHGAPCAWSTNYGRQMPAFFNKNDLRMPWRKLTKWDDEKLLKVGAEYTAKFWSDMRYLVRPDTFEDLYRYFDSSTLWMNGAYNMWNLVNMLVTQAHERWPAVLADWKACIDSFVQDCIHARPGYEHNQQALRQWDGRRDMLEHARGFHDWPYDEINVTFDLQQQDMVREALICQYLNEYRDQYNAQQCIPPQYYPYYPRPDANMPAVPVTATGEAAPHTVAARAGPLVVSSVPINTGLPTTPAATEQKTVPRTVRPTSGSLISIPEELDTSKSDVTAAEASGATTKAEVIAGNASQEPIPEIVTKDATPPRDNAIRDRKDSNGSNDRLFFDPQPSSGHLEAQSRQLSTSSAPAAELEPMLTEADLSSQKRIASEAPPAVSSQVSSKPSQQKPKGKNKNGKQGSGSGSRKEHSGNAAMYHSGQQPQQQGPPPLMKLRGPHPSQQVISTIGPLQGPMPPPTLLAPGQPGMLSGPNGFMPHNQPPPPPDMPFTRPPMVPFYDQVPMPPPHVRHSQFGHPNEGPPSTMPYMNMPPPFTGPQHRGPVVHQPSSYIQQLEHQNSHKQGRGSLDNRRNSIKSTGSRKVRDDPIHGAIYVLPQPRKINHASYNRQSSDTNPPHHGSTAHSSCKNSWFKKSLEPRHFNRLLFNDCSCGRCDEATRGVYVRACAPPDPSDPEGNIARHFAKFGPIAVRYKKSGFLVVFQTDLSAMSAVQEACANPDKSIKGWTSSATVWYPFYSRHYTGDFKGNTAGLPRHLYQTQARPSSFNSNARRDSNSLRGLQTTGPKLANVGLAPTHRAVQHASAVSQGLIPDPNFVPGKDVPVPTMPLPPQQRQLWVPPPTLPRVSAASASIPVNQRSASCDVGANQCQEVTLKKEDWRSKPPSEEALSEAGDDIAVTDTASNHSSQGAKSIKVSLPSEDGSACEAISRSSSRSGTPDADRKPQESALQQPSEEDVEAKVVTSEPDVTKGDHENSATSSGTVTPGTVKPVQTHKKKAPKVSQETQRIPVEIEKSAPHKPGEINAPKNTSEKTSGYRKTATDLAAPVESLEESSNTSKGSYRKTAEQLSSAVEQFNYPMDTIIRHKQPRAALPTEWATGQSASKGPSSVMKEPDATSEIRSRLGEINTNLALDELLSQTDQNILEKALKGNETLVVDTQQAPQTQQPKSGSEKKYKKRKLQGGHSQPIVSRSNTPTNTQPRGPSPASNRPPSSATISGPSRGPSPALQNNPDNQPTAASGTIRKNKKSKAKRKQAKLAASQDKQRDNTSENPTSSQTEPVEKHKPEATEAADETQRKLDKQLDNSNSNIKYRANNGGSLKMYKSRSPKNEQKTESQDKEDRSPTKGGIANTALSTIFEPPTKEKNRSSSPDANLFPQQKFSIDQARKAGPPRKMSLDTTTQQMSAPKATEENPKVSTNLPRTTSTTKQPSGAWADVVRGNLKSKDDPFSAGKGEETPKEWMKQSPQKNRPQTDDVKAPKDQVSPTPSPEKRSHRPTKSKNKLNAAAQSFMSSRTSSPAPKLRLDPTAKEFTSSHPPSPAMSIVSAANTLGHRKTPSLPGQSSGIDKRLVTPVEQVFDASQLLQPGPPAKERKNGPLPDRTGGNPNLIPVKNPRPIPANTAAAKSQQAKKEQKQDKDETPNDNDAWQTVMSARKSTSTSGGAARGRGGRGGRWAQHGQVGRGRRVGDAEERKGG